MKYIRVPDEITGHISWLVRQLRSTDHGEAGLVYTLHAGRAKHVRLISQPRVKVLETCEAPDDAKTQ